MDQTTNKRKKRRMIFGAVMIGITLIILALLLREHTPKIVKLLEEGNVSGIETYIQAQGSRGRALLILLQVIETVTIVLPALPVYICAGAIYGKLQGILMCYLTNLVMNLIIFRIAGHMKATTEEFLKYQKNPKLEEWMEQAKHPARVVLLMCALPIVPNGLIPYISAQTNVTTKDFMKAMSIGCLPGVLFFVSCGDLLLSEHFKVTLPVVIVAAVVILVLMVNKKRIAAWMEPRIEKFLG